jgi:muramidase (phage lysozyme)
MDQTRVVNGYTQVLTPTGWEIQGAAPSSSGSTTTSDSGLSPAAYSVLAKISSGESQDYHTIYGGQQFDSFADHPRIKVSIPDRPGLYSTAAGKYQFLAGTWDAQASKLGLTDFSPRNQDLAAWDLAQTTYKNQTGRDLTADQQAGKVDYSALAGQWPSLRGSTGASPSPSTGTSSSKLGGQPGGQPANQLYSSPDEVPQQPNPAIVMAQLQALAPTSKFTPVDYDPWKVEGHL